MHLYLLRITLTVILRKSKGDAIKRCWLFAPKKASRKKIFEADIFDAAL